MSRRALTVLSAVLLALTGCGTDDAASPQAVVVDGGPAASEAAAVLLEGTGITVRSDVPAGAEAVLVTTDLPAGGWADVAAYAERAVEPAAAQLRDAFPAHADRIEANAAAYLGDLAKLDDYARRVVGLVPESDRRLETSHAELRPFGDAYGLDVVAVDRPTELDGELLIDGPVPPGEFEATYLGRMDHNVTAIGRHLGAPGLDVHGLFGRLTRGHDHDAHEDHGEHEDHDDHGEHEDDHEDHAGHGGH